MAGDWIPMRTNLQDDPTVVCISRAVNMKPQQVVGLLHCFWSWADSHTTDGRLLGIDAAWIDEKVGKRGFAKAMSQAPMPWLVIDDSGVSIPNFLNWFGSSAKSRLLNTRRQQLSRSERDKSATEARPQNRTEENIITTTLGDEDFRWIATKAKAITDKLGRCGTERNRRLLLGACAIVRSGAAKESWLDNAVRAAREANAAKPYAYLQKVLAVSAEPLGFGLVASVEAINLTSVPKAQTLVLEAPSC